MAFDPPGWTLPLLQCLHGLSFGASHLGAIAFIAHAAPEGRGATAQGYFSVMQGITLSGCMLLAGFLYERVGMLSYLAMALMALLGGLIALAVWLRSARASRLTAQLQTGYIDISSGPDRITIWGFRPPCFFSQARTRLG